jgi:Leucine-rich repeat (LRR) protein
MFVMVSCITPYEVRLENAKRNSTGLDLSSSGYIRLNDEILGFPHLDRINLSNNPNISWDTEAEKLSRIKGLTTLFLNDNPGVNLKPIIIELSKLKNFKHLYLSGAGITRLPVEISALSKLEIIDLSNNPGLDIVDAIDKLSQLKTIRFIFAQNCSISQLPKKIESIKSIEVINLYGNDLDSLPDLSQLENIHSIDIGKNKFRSVPVTITKIRKRINFYAQSNQITSLPKDLELMKFGTFNLTNNPLTELERYKIKKTVNARYKFY